MTARDKFGEKLERHVVIHELGHCVVGRLLGFRENGAEFFRSGSSDSGHVGFQWDQGTPAHPLLMRALAGIYSQAVIVPESVCDNMREQVIEGEFEAGLRDMIERNRFLPEIHSEGLAGDWVFIWEIGRRAGLSTDDLVIAVDRAHKALAKLFEDEGFKSMFLACEADLNTWFDTDDEERQFDDTFTYSVARFGPIVDQFREGLSENDSNAPPSADSE